MIDEQLRAASAVDKRLYIEASPGAGKTSVAAERFGLQHYGAPADGRATLGFAYTRLAAAELCERVRSRWGSAALRWPNRIDTLDSLLRDILTWLLRMGQLRWPGGHEELKVSDTWEAWGVRTWQSWKPRLAPVLHIVESGQIEFGGPEQFHGPLAEGRCTHDEIRTVIAGALDRRVLKAAIADFLRASVRSVIVDEAFDVNELDLRILELLCEQDVSMTLIGDPWQALYEFRGARPLLAEALLMNYGFHPVRLRRSFRFRNAATRELAEHMRTGRPVTIPRWEAAGPLDVALAARWEDMWRLGPEILPLSFGRPTSSEKALATLLLNRFASTVLKTEAVYVNDALRRLNLPTDVDLGEELDDVLLTLRKGGVDAVDAAGERLLQVVREVGPTGRWLAVTHGLRRLLRNLARRVESQSTGFIPGMTVHQAKGREWDAVGFLAREEDLSALRTGLDRGRAGDRQIYVALTRGRYSTFLLTAAAEERSR
ncbi:UvrD-helicase domain-containing protein [Thermopolyspora sp. NPDC052614]|uniref:UvrD-helicase domain-containing protein n=1 Tax=Thermopolyspora sp. NPDC052614 TaxID=3155682 RepID=UPI0034176672